MFNGNCFRCGDPGHLAAQCPEQRPPATLAEHQARLTEYQARFQRWLDGTPGTKWTREEKTRAIEAENRMWNTEKARKAA